MKRKIISVVLALIMCVNALPIAAVMEESPEQAQLRQELYRMVDALEYPNGLISFLTPQMECVEGQDYVEFAVVRYGLTGNAASVEFKAIDISARYGEDYYITVPRTFIDDRLEMDADAIPILEFTAMQANASEMTLGDEPLGEDSADEDTFDEEDIPEEYEPSGDREILYSEDLLTYDNGTVEMPNAASGTLGALAAARTALLGVPTDTTTWQGLEEEKAAAAEALLAQTRGYYDDLPGASYTLNFAPGENMKVLRFYVIDDLISENDEQVMFVLTNVQGSALDPNPTGYMNIVDNGAAVSSVYVFEEATVYANAGDTYVTATLLRLEGLERYDTVTVGTSALTAIPGIDYPALDQQITFVPGQTRQTVRIPVLSNDRAESRTFNLQTRGETITAAVTVVLPSTENGAALTYVSDSYPVMPLASDESLDPADKSGHSFNKETSYKGLEGNGNYKYRVYTWSKEIKGTASDSIGRLVYLEPASMGGIEKVKYTIEDLENGTIYTNPLGWVNDIGFYVGSEDRLGVMGGSTFYLSDNVQKSARVDVTANLTDFDRTKRIFVLSTRAKDGNQNTRLKLSYMDIYVSPVELVLKTPAEEDPDGRVNAYSWNSEKARDPSFTSYKMGQLGFAGDIGLTNKIVYADGDASGKVSFVPAYADGITADIAAKTYLWGYKIERKANLSDGIGWYYVKGTDFDVTDFMSDRMRDSVTGATILHNTCGNAYVDENVTYYSFNILPVYKAKDAIVKLSWDSTKLQADKGAFTNGKSMNIGMLDTINYRLVSAEGSNELPSKFSGYIADGAVDQDDTSVEYSLTVSAARPFDSPDFDENLSFTLTLISRDGSMVAHDVTMNMGDELSRLFRFVVTQTFTFSADELGINDIVSASLSTSSLDQNTTLSGTFEMQMMGRTFQKTEFPTTKVPSSKSNFTLSGNFEQVFSYTIVDNFPHNAAEPGRFSFSPTRAYTEIIAVAGSASIDIRYDPASSSEGKNIGTVLNIQSDGTGKAVDPDTGLQIDDVKLNSLYTFNAIYADEGDGGANVLRNSWRIQWKDWSGDTNRDGVITQEEQALLGDYGNKIDRTAVIGNTFQYVPLLFNSQIYYSFVRRDAAPDDGRILTIAGSVVLQRGTVLNNADPRGLITNSIPVSGATVTVDGMSTTTDANGVFIFSNAYFRSGENYLAVISYNGLTYSVVMQVNAFKNIFLQEYNFFTPYDLKAYVKNGGSYSSINLNNPVYPDNSDGMQMWTFKIQENVANITAKEVSLNLYDKDGNRLASIPAKFNNSSFMWEAEFNPANYDGVTSGEARVLPAGSTMKISIIGSDDITYPEFEVGVLFKKSISTVTVLNTFRTPVNQVLDYIGNLESQFNLGLSVKVDKELKDKAQGGGNSVLISFGINKEFEGQFGTTNDDDDEDEDGKKDKKDSDKSEDKSRAASKGDSKKPSDAAKSSSKSNILDYLKDIAKNSIGEGAESQKANEAVTNALKGTAAFTDGSIIEGYRLNMGIGLYLSMRIDETSGEFYFDGLVVAAAMIGDVGYKFSMATPIGVTLTAGFTFGGNITGLVAVEPHNFFRLKLGGDGLFDISKAGNGDTSLDIYGKLIVMPYVIVSAGVDISAFGFASANATVTGKAVFDMAFSTAGTGSGSVNMTVELALNVLGLFSKKWTLVDGTWQLFSYGPKSLSAVWDGDYRYDIVTSSDTMERTYLLNRSGWNGSGNGISTYSGIYGGGILGNSGGWSREDTLLEGVYPYAYPIIESIGDSDGDGVQEQLMVFLDTDITDQYAQNSTRLYYTIFKNNRWSEPAEVDYPDDGLHDDTPSMADLGDRVLVVWTSATSRITDNTDPIDAMNNRNIKARFFYKDTHTWSDITNVTMNTAEDTTGDDKPTIIYCEDYLGNRYLMLTYVKSAHVASGANGEDALVGDLLDPKSELAYRFYDFNTESWVSTYDDATMQRLTYALGSEEAAKRFEKNWYGQNFVNLSVGTSAYALGSIPGYDPVITDNCGTSFIDSNGHAIGLSAYIVDMDGDKSTGYDREIFIEYYDFTDNIIYNALRITNDDVEQSYVSSLNSLDGAEIFFLSNGSVQALNVEHLWETLVDNGYGNKELRGEPAIYTAVAAIDENTPIIEFVVSSDGENDYIFWTETDISYVDGVEPNSEESDDPSNQIAERHIYGAWRSINDAAVSVLYDENGDVITYPEGFDYNTIPDINGQIGVVKAGDPVAVITRTWGSPIQITDEAGANFSDIDVTLLYDGAFRMVYLKGYSTLHTVGNELVAAEDIQNRLLCTADFNVGFTSYQIELDPITELTSADYVVPVTATVKNIGFRSDENDIYAELFVSTDGGGAELVSVVKIDDLSSGKSANVTFDWKVPSRLQRASFTANVISMADGEFSRLYDKASTQYERSADIGIKVLSAEMVDVKLAEVSVLLHNYGDAPAVDQIVIASAADVHSMSQTYTLKPDEETTLTFKVNVPDDAFVSVPQSDSSVIDIAQITLSSGSAPAIAEVTRTASAEYIAIAGSIESVSLTDSDGNVLEDTIIVEKNEVVTLGLTAEMTGGYDDSLLSLILVSEDGTIICDGDRFVASGNGVITAYIVPKGSAALLTAGGMATELDILHLIAAEAIKTITLNVKIKSGSDKPLPPNVPGSPWYNQYEVIISGNSSHADIHVSPVYPMVGQNVTVTVRPDAGYDVSLITVTDIYGNKIHVTDNGDGTYSFTMPASNVTVSVTCDEVADIDPPTQGKMMNDDTTEAVDISHGTIVWVVPTLFAVIALVYAVRRRKCR